MACGRLRDRAEKASGDKDEKEFCLEGGEHNIPAMAPTLSTSPKVIIVSMVKNDTEARFSQVRLEP